MVRTVPARKLAYGQTLRENLTKFNSLLVISVDNIGSKQLQEIRIMLRPGNMNGKPTAEGKATPGPVGTILMGKNTIMRKILREEAEKGTAGCAELLPLIKNNVGFVFTNDNLAYVRELILNRKVPAAAKSGMIAPEDVYIPPGPTGLDPGQTSFFQALNIQTKITKGAIEIISKVHICQKDVKVSASAVVLMSKLNIRPFFYACLVLHVMDKGSVYPAAILDVNEDELVGKFLAGIRSLASVSLATYYPTAASVPHTFSNSIRMLIAISLMGEYSFKYAEPYKAFLGASGNDGEEEEEEAAGDKAE